MRGKENQSRISISRQSEPFLINLLNRGRKGEVVTIQRQCDMRVLVICVWEKKTRSEEYELLVWYAFN